MRYTEVKHEDEARVQMVRNHEWSQCTFCIARGEDIAVAAHDFAVGWCRAGRREGGEEGFGRHLLMKGRFVNASEGQRREPGTT